LVCFSSFNISFGISLLAYFFFFASYITYSFGSGFMNEPIALARVNPTTNSVLQSILKEFKSSKALQGTTAAL